MPKLQACMLSHMLAQARNRHPPFLLAAGARAAAAALPRRQHHGRAGAHPPHERLLRGLLPSLNAWSASSLRMPNTLLDEQEAGGICGGECPHLCLALAQI